MNSSNERWQKLTKCERAVVLALECAQIHRDGGRTSPKELANLTGYEAGEVEAAVEHLAELGMLSRTMATPPRPNA